MAVLKPPHLAAIMAWEGISDLYREVNTMGGIPNVSFQSLWMDMTGNGLRECEDHAVAGIEHPLFDDWWKSKVVDWSKIDVPAFSVTGWSSLGLHLRGTIAAWKEFSSKHKYLQIHVRILTICIVTIDMADQTHRAGENGSSTTRTRIYRNRNYSGIDFSKTNQTKLTIGLQSSSIHATPQM